MTSTASPGVTRTVTATSTATATVTATGTPSTPVTTPAATTSPTAAVISSGSGASLVWLWVLLGAAVLAGLIVWIVRSARRRSAATADWRSRLIDAYAKGSALHDAMSAAEGPGEFADSNA